MANEDTVCLSKMSKKQTETTDTETTDTETTDTKKQTKTTDTEKHDRHNANIMKVWTEQGAEEAVKKMFVHPENGTRMSYSEMRSFYG